MEPAHPESSGILFVEALQIVALSGLELSFDRRKGENATMVSSA
jgi:hypothetical protein